MDRAGTVRIGGGSSPHTRGEAALGPYGIDPSLRLQFLASVLQARPVTTCTSTSATFRIRAASTILHHVSRRTTTYMERWAVVAVLQANRADDTMPDFSRS